MDDKTPEPHWLKSVKFHPVDRVPRETDLVPDNIPFVTHEGILKIGDVELKVYQLNTGQRVINSESFAALFGGKSMEEVIDELRDIMEKLQ
jgi:hypothetical protein